MASYQLISHASYEQYKGDTEYILRWIDHTAKSCGWRRKQRRDLKADPLPLGSSTPQNTTKAGGSTWERNGDKIATGPGRLKGKDRKVAKQKAASAAAAAEKEKKDEHTRGVVLSTAEILEQAGLISTHLLTSKSGTSQPPPSLNRYEYLIETTVQDEPEYDHGFPATSSKPSIAGSDQSAQNYHMDIKNSQENALMVFTLFTDVNNLKMEVRRLWERCFKDGADMVVATLLTAQALAFVQRSEEKALSVLPPPTYREGDHKCAWSHPGTYCRLLSILRDPNDTQAVLQFEDSSHTTELLGETVNINDLTFIFSARRLFDISVAEDLTSFSPLLTRFEHNPPALLNTDIGKVLNRDGSLCRLVHEIKRYHSLQVPHELSHGIPELTRQLEMIRSDPITDYLLPVWTQKEVSLTSVFAAEIMVDIKEICDAFPGSRKYYSQIIDHYKKHLALGPAPSRSHLLYPVHSHESPIFKTACVVSKDRDTTVNKLYMILIKVSSLLAEVTGSRDERDLTEAEREKAEEILKTDLAVLELEDGEWYQQTGLIDFIWPPTNDNYLFENHPIFSTMREAFLQTTTESIGIDLLNTDRIRVGAMAHIYNASRQLGIDTLQWPAMDRLIELHKIALFAGDVPNTPAAMLKSFSHRNFGPEITMTYKKKIKLLNRAATWMKTSATTQALQRTPRHAMEEYLTKQFRDVRVDYVEISRINHHFSTAIHEHARSTFARLGLQVLQDEEKDGWSGIQFVAEAFKQEEALHDAMAKCDGDISKVPVQYCDYMQDSINCLARTLSSMGIGGCSSADGQAVNLPVAQKRFAVLDS
ncbi:hypothetical protein Daus18300_010623 [Diaporthe australafricana]|uniref:DUF6604 domain-containing protein n=1 Tax=Diaporthe australafricana TaxID=127596 RepID=A0ABR3W9P8_9PEZI